MGCLTHMTLAWLIMIESPGQYNVYSANTLRKMTLKLEFEVGVSQD